jgi:hypothetical protein
MSTKEPPALRAGHTVAWLFDSGTLTLTVASDHGTSSGFTMAHVSKGAARCVRRLPCCKTV